MNARNEKTGLIHSIKFNSQIKFPYSGAMACTVISIVTASRLLRMEKNEFFDVFNNMDTNKVAIDILNSCLEAGVKLKSKISPTLFGGWIKSNVVEDVSKIAKLPENFAGSKDLEIVGDTIAIAISHENLESGIAGLISLNDMINSKMADDYCFIATTNGHTTVFFSKENLDISKRYFISIDSFPKEFFKGKFELFDSYDSLMQDLIIKWGNGKTPMVDITVVRLSKNQHILSQENPQAKQINTLGSSF